MLYRDAFEAELLPFRDEVASLTKTFYSYVHLNKLAKRSDVMEILQANAGFWNTYTYAMSQTIYIVLGRIFGQSNDQHGLQSLLKAMEYNLHLFTSDEYSQRQIVRHDGNIELVEERVANFTTFPGTEFYRRFISTAIKNYQTFNQVRNLIVAHRISTDRFEREQIFSQATMSKIESILQDLRNLFEALWHMYENSSDFDMSSTSNSWKASAERELEAMFKISV